MSFPLHTHVGFATTRAHRPDDLCSSPLSKHPEGDTASKDSVN